MNQSTEPESGYIGHKESTCYMGSVMRDVEVLRDTSTYIIARGHRYGRQWFIKGLRPEMRDSTTMRRRLQKEFEIHSRLRHPNIVQAVGFEEIEGLGWCIIQEWVDGETLNEALRKGRLNGADRRRIVRELTVAAAYLHRSGVVHRDFKPSNVMIRKTGGETVVIDFGLADSDDYVEIKGPAGTRGFISPEQLEAGGVSASDDVYSLGVVMREVSPRYRGIANRCTGPVRKRPKDAGALLKAIGRRDRRPKIVVAFLLVLVLVSVAGLVALRFKALETAADSSRDQIAAMTDKNAGNERLVTNLQDSLSTMHDRLNTTRDELTRVKEYEALRTNIYKEGCHRIDIVFNRYNRNVFSKVAEGDVAQYNDALIKLTDELETVIGQYMSSAKNRSALTASDADKLKMDLHNYEADKLSEYQTKWQKKLYPAT